MRAMSYERPGANWERGGIDKESVCFESDGPTADTKMTIANQ